MTFPIQTSYPGKKAVITQVITKIPILNLSENNTSRIELTKMKNKQIARR